MESKHGRAGVHAGALAWEQSRNQLGVITTGRAVPATFYQVTYEDHYDYVNAEWNCGMCSKCFTTQRGLEQHLESGTHEEARYSCKECGRQFTSLSAQRMHFESTGHSRIQERLAHTLVADAQRSSTLMLTNGSARSDDFEATLQFDGAARPNPGNGGTGWHLVDDRGLVLDSDGAPVGRESIPTRLCTNNQAEYMALINGLVVAVRFGIKRLRVQGDSDLVIQQMKGKMNCNSDNLIGLHERAKTLVAVCFQRVDFTHISRDRNTIADRNASDNCY